MPFGRNARGISFSKGGWNYADKGRADPVLEENRNRAVSGQEAGRHAAYHPRGGMESSPQPAGGRIPYRGGAEPGIPAGAGYRRALGAGVALFLPEEYRTARSRSLPTVDSTNSAAKRLAAGGAPHRTLVLAEKQTAGRGRRGRSFYSPAETGLSMSVLLRPNSTLQDALPVTAAAAVAVCRAAEALTGRRPGIKWVNDLFLDGRKISGILTEAISDFESRMAEAVIRGDRRQPPTTDFPDESWPASPAPCIRDRSPATSWPPASLQSFSGWRKTCPLLP